MENWKQKFADLAKEKNINFHKDEKDIWNPNKFWINYNFSDEYGRYCTGSFRVRSWKHAYKLLKERYLED